MTLSHRTYVIMLLNIPELNKKTEPYTHNIMHLLRHITHSYGKYQSKTCSTRSRKTDKSEYKMYSVYSTAH